jgi:hypothetical protein
MLFDTHTNLMWYPDHLSDEFVEFAWSAKQAKMKLSPAVCRFRADARGWPTISDSTAEKPGKTVRGGVEDLTRGRGSI